MDPTKPESFNHRVEKLPTGRTYHFVMNSDSAARLFNHQIGPWVREGCRVVVPDMLGYGGTDKPWDADEYTTKKLCTDLAALLDLIGVNRAVLVGHDWGSHTVGRFALWHSHRVLALVMLSVPYTPPSPVYLPIEEVAKKAPNLGYQVYFANQKSTKAIEANLEKFLNIVFRSPNSTINFTEEGSLEEMLGDSPLHTPDLVLRLEEFQYYNKVLSKGMNGPLNYYRTSKQRHEEELAARLPSNLRSDLPVLFLWGTRDQTATPSIVRKSANFVPRLQDIALEGRGHWVMVESKDEVTRHIADWLKSLGSPKGKL